MRYFKRMGFYGPEILSEKEVLQEYYAYWSEKMRQQGRHDMITNESCIIDWCTLHWGYEVDEDEHI